MNSACCVLTDCYKYFRTPTWFRICQYFPVELLYQCLFVLKLDNETHSKMRTKKYIIHFSIKSTLLI